MDGKTLAVIIYCLCGFASSVVYFLIIFCSVTKRGSQQINEAHQSSE